MSDCVDIINGQDEQNDSSYQEFVKKQNAFYDKQMEEVIKSSETFDGNVDSVVKAISKTRYDDTIRDLVYEFRGSELSEKARKADREEFIQSVNSLRSLNNINLSLEDYAKKVKLANQTAEALAKTSEFLIQQMKEVVKDEKLEKSGIINYMRKIQDHAIIMDNVIESFKEEFEGLGSSHPFMQKLNQSQGSIKTLNKEYNKNAKEILTDFMLDLIPKENQSISESNLEKIKELEEKRDNATKSYTKDYFTREIQKIKNKKIDREKIKKALDGVTDSNLVSMFLEAAIMNGDPIIAGFSKKLYISREKVRAEFLSKTHPRIIKLFDKWKDIKGGTSNNLKSMNKELVENILIYKVIRGQDKEEVEKHYNIVKESEDGKVLLVSAYHFNINKWYSEKFNHMLAELDFDIAVAEDRDKSSENIELQKARKAKQEFLRKYSDREYTDAYYEIKESLPDNIRKIINQIDSDIKYAQNELHINPSYENYKAFLKERNKKANLKYEKYTTGPKIGEFTDIAVVIKEYYEKLNDLYEDQDYTDLEIKIAEERYLAERASRLADINNGIDKGEIPIPKNTDRKTLVRNLIKAFDMNSRVTFYKQEYWEAKLKIIDRINEINKQLNVGNETKSESIKELYEDIFMETGGFRDEEKNIIGQMYTIEESEKIRQIEEDIELIKDSDLSEKDKDLTDELKKLYLELEDIQEKIFTDYYHVEVERRKDKIKNKMLADKKAAGDNTNVKEDDVNKAFENSDWYKANHVKKTRWQESEKGWEKIDVDEPIFIWRKVIPRDEKNIVNRPANRYFNKENKIKEKYKNKNKVEHKFGLDVPVPKEGTIFDKRSEEYKSRPESFRIEGEKEYPVNEQIKEVLEEYTDIYAEQQESLETNRRFGYSLPMREKGTLDRVFEGQNLFTKIKQYIQDILRKFKKTDQDVEDGLGLDISGINEEGIQKDDRTGLYDKVPLRYKKSSKEANEFLSYDIFGTLADFSYRNMLRAELELLLPTAKMLLEVTKGKDKGIFTENNKTKFWAPDIIKSKLPKRHRHLQEIIKTHFFGEYETETTLNIGNTNLSINKLVGRLNGFTALTTLGHNIHGALTNWLSAESQKIIALSINGFMTYKQYRKGHALFSQKGRNVLLDGIQVSENRDMYTNMLIGWNAVQGQFEEVVNRDFGNTNTKNAIRTFGYAMTLRQAGELQTQGSMWFGKMDSITVMLENSETKEIKEVSLLEAYEEIYKENQSTSLSGYDGKFKIYNTKLDKKGNFKKGTQFTINDENDLKLELLQTNLRLNGNYEKLNKTVLEKHFIGKGLTLFRRFFVSIGVNRWGGINEERYNIGKKDWHSGFYITTLRALRDVARSGFDSEVRKDIWGNQNKKEAISQTLKETGLLAALGILLELMGYDDDDKEIEKMGFWKLHLMYQAAKLKSEIQTFSISGGTELKGIYKNPATAYFQLNNAHKFIKNLFNLVTNDEDAYYKRDAGLGIFGRIEKGDPKIYKDLLKLTGLNPIAKTIVPSELVKGYKTGQTLRDR
jgi:hypothetical protein